MIGDICTLGVVVSSSSPVVSTCCLGSPQQPYRNPTHVTYHEEEFDHP